MSFEGHENEPLSSILIIFYGWFIEDFFFKASLIKFTCIFGLSREA